MVFYHKYSIQDKITYNISLLSLVSLVSNHHIDKVCATPISKENVLMDSRTSQKMDSSISSYL